MLSKLSYANVMATIAVFVALGGTSYAAITITGKNVKNESLTSADVKDKSLLRKDFKSGQLPAGANGAKGDTGAAGSNGAKGDTGAAGSNGAKGDTGAPGAPGAKGDIGAQGAPGVSGYQQVLSGTIANPAGTQRNGFVSCPAGQRVLGGGVAGLPSITQSVNSSYPSDDTTWMVSMNNTAASGTTSAFRVFAICGVVQ